MAFSTSQSGPACIGWSEPHAVYHFSWEGVRVGMWSGESVCAAAADSGTATRSAGQPEAE